jgi:hypothetical protein
VGIDKLDSLTFDQLMASEPFLANTSDVAFDLRAIQFVAPSGLVQLAAACYSLAWAGRKPRILIDNESVRTYVARAGFASVISDVAEIHPYLSPGLYGYRRGANPMLIEVTQIETGEDLPDLLDQIVWVLRNRLKYRKYDAFDAVTAISEICQNTFDHNSGTSGFIAMQVYGRGKKRFLEIGVADHGCGLATTLRRNPKNGAIASDAVAIEMATKLGVSEHDDPTRGAGLHHLLNLTYKHEGSVQIRSGEAKARFRMDKRQGWMFSVPTVPGVQVALTLRSKAA